MTLIVIFFFISLVAMIFMIGRKMAFLKRNQIIIEESISLETPHIEDIKHATIKKMRQYEYIVIASVVRNYLKSSKFVKEKGSDMLQGVRGKLRKNNEQGEGEDKEAQEVSKFLKMVTDYKHKVKKIRRKIREEEGI